MNDRNILRRETVPVPSRITERLPDIVVGYTSAIPNHEVQRARAAEHLSARPVIRMTIRGCLRNGVDYPIQRRSDRRAEKSGDIDQVVSPDAWTSLDDENRNCGICRETSGKSEPSSPAPDDDIVVFGVAFLCCGGFRDEA